MLIVGAKGFAKELVEAILQRDPAAEVAFYDDISEDLPELNFGKYRILKSESDAVDYFTAHERSFALGIGDPQLRYKLGEKFVQLGGELTTIISPYAIIGRFGNIIENGVNILATAIIETDNVIGEGSLIHVGSLISHDTRIGRFCEISPGAKILGRVSVGEFCSLGAGCIILPRIKIGNNAVVGAGAVVTKDVPDNVTVVGVPARPLPEKGS